MGYVKSDPMLSVIVPVYNVEKYLDRCLESVLRQSYTNMEIILVDDGSTDHSGMICDRYAVNDSRIKVIHKKNGGLVSARKAGLKTAGGNYIAYVDSDDWIASDMYKSLIRLMLESGADLATSGCVREYGNYSVVQREKMQPGIYEKEKLVKKFLKKMISTELFFNTNVIFTAWNKIYRKELAERCQNTVDDFINIGEDVALSYACFLNAEKIAVSGKNFYHYCIRNDSIMGKKKEDEIVRYQILFQHMESCAKRHVDKVSNIMEQVKIHEYYFLFLQFPERVVYYKDGILFPFGSVGKNDKIVIYGAGRFGCALKKLLEYKYNRRIAAWIDRSDKAETQMVDDIDKIRFDKIIIAVLLDDLKNEIKKWMIKKGIAEEKILLVNLQMFKDKR